MACSESANVGVFRLAPERSGQAWLAWRCLFGSARLGSAHCALTSLCMRVTTSFPSPSSFAPSMLLRARSPTRSIEAGRHSTICKFVSDICSCRGAGGTGKAQTLDGARGTQ